ncbi:AraC family transcriptional regulator [Clostridium bowmanii]|uniref:AraC family transcriptional regulator n=1 Tax=Clostridium bowmanii TaxID=132925 RepID=UPI001C0D220B|nr:AraC family transcriptional regulator [Clostridium bowmanii]MBU3188944.1 AraC family transcriptional regulator [Clostridium bowmanii]MCA1073647.1 AraC family transcriptional regulator [Clostridium bowmanii]
MEYINLIQKTIDYIDAHIEDKLSVDTLASIAGFSTYHYYKIFSSFVHLSVMDYVTKRKLQFALQNLTNGAKIIDIAMDYGFETHAGFNKAVKRAFGYPPSLYRIHAPKGLPPKINLVYLRNNQTGGIIMGPKIIEMPSFKVVGYEFKNNLKNVLRSSDIPAFWAQRGFDDNNCEEKLYQQLTPLKHGEYCICINTNMDTDDFSYLMGVGVDNFDKAIDDMYKLEIPAATYAIFTTPEVQEENFIDSINGTWTYILQQWFPNSQYEIDESKFDFEHYDEHCHSWEYDKVSMKIYIPIKSI